MPRLIAWPDGRPLSRADGRPLVMGILNITPDSFSDGGRFDGFDAAIAHAHAMARDGADIIDIGGESTRPGHVPVSADDEIARVLPVIEALAGPGGPGLPLSIDTWKSTVAQVALRAGATIVNDVWGFRREPAIAEVAASAGAIAIAMANRETIDPNVDIVTDVLASLRISIEIGLAAGLRADALVIDPGIGFGKSFAQNVRMIAKLGSLEPLGHPILMGLSRKSTLGQIIDEPIADRRLAATLAGNIVAVQRGADMIRVHDVKPHVDVLKLLTALAEHQP